MQKDRFANGLIVKPSFDPVVDDVRKSLRIPIPDRAAKAEAQSVLRAHLMELSQMQTAAQMQVHDYHMGADTLPMAAMRLGPSQAGAAPAFQRMNDHAHTRTGRSDRGRSAPI